MDWKEDAIYFLQEHTDASLDIIIDWICDYWQNLNSNEENLKDFLISLNEL